jgi:hypothetical protein
MSPPDRPVIRTWTAPARFIFVSCLLFVGLLLAGSWWAWRHLPVGHDFYFGRGFLLVVPAIVAFISLTALPKSECVRSRWKFSSRGLLPVCSCFFLLYAAGSHVLLILAAIGRPVHATVQWMLVPVGLFNIGLGNSLGKCRDDFFFRIRTPWTVRSVLAWNRTNRLEAWLYVGSGLIIVGGAHRRVRASAGHRHLGAGSRSDGDVLGLFLFAVARRSGSGGFQRVRTGVAAMKDQIRRWCRAAGLASVVMWFVSPAGRSVAVAASVGATPPWPRIEPTYRDVAYAQKSPAEKLDLYLPETRSHPVPLVIWIHGGAFMVGDKRSMPRRDFGPPPPPRGPYGISRV